MLQLLVMLMTQVAGVAPQASRPLDIAFRAQMIDPGFSESVAVADFNKDGRLDILSAEYCASLTAGAVSAPATASVSLSPSPSPSLTRN